MAVAPAAVQPSGRFGPSRQTHVNGPHTHVISVPSAASGMSRFTCASTSLPTRSRVGCGCTTTSTNSSAPGDSFLVASATLPALSVMPLSMPADANNEVDSILMLALVPLCAPGESFGRVRHLARAERRAAVDACKAQRRGDRMPYAAMRIMAPERPRDVYPAEGCPHLTCGNVDLHILRRGDALRHADSAFCALCCLLEGEHHLRPDAARAHPLHSEADKSQTAKHCVKSRKPPRRSAPPASGRCACAAAACVKITRST